MKNYNKLKSKRKIVDKRSTIDEMHDGKMNDFESYYKTLPDKKLNLENMNTKLNSMKDLYSLEYSTLKQDIVDLKKEISRMENKTDMYDYLLNVQNILMKTSQRNTIDELTAFEEADDYDSQGDTITNFGLDTINENEVSQDYEEDPYSKPNKTTLKQNSQLLETDSQSAVLATRKHYLQDDLDDDIDPGNAYDTKSSFTRNTKLTSGIESFITVKEINNKEDLVTEYIYASNGQSYDPTQIGREHESLDIYTCTICSNNMTYMQKECYLVCDQCGICKSYQDPDMPQWSDQIDVSKAYSYKRPGYFIEHLYRIQARECTLIPDAVINKIMLELKKLRITNVSDINVKLIRGILKKLELTNYYDNVNSIIRKLSGNKAPEFPDDLEDKLVSFFHKTLEPFERYKSIIRDRNNYLSYPYVIRKLLVILAHQENNPEYLKFVKWFPLLKSRQKLWDQEKLWEKICEHNDWPFIKSI